MGYLEHYSIGRRNLEKEKNWENLDPKSFKVTKPTVFCFGGNATIDSKDANAMCKIAQSLVGIKQPTIENEFATTEAVDFIGIAYGKADDKGIRSSSLTKEERTEFAETIFLPLCIDENKNLLPKNKIIKNFNQITFFSHCWGTREICSIIGRGLHKMLELGIDKATATQAFRQVFSVSYAPYQEYVCTGLQVLPMKDKNILGPIYGAEISNRFLMDTFMGRIHKGNGTIAFKENDHTVSVLVSDMTKDLNNEHFIHITARDSDWKYKEGMPVYGDEVSKVMGNALASSIANSIQNQNSDSFTPKPSLDTILEETQSILADTQCSEFESEINQIKEELNLKLNEQTPINNSLISESTGQPSVIETTTSSSITSESLQNLQSFQPKVESVEFEQ